jgi:beta-lactam-binding protein with PASTA domain
VATETFKFPHANSVFETRITLTDGATEGRVNYKISLFNTDTTIWESFNLFSSGTSSPLTNINIGSTNFSKNYTYDWKYRTTQNVRRTINSAILRDLEALQFRVGMSRTSGVGIPAGATITATSTANSTVTMSVNATSSGTSSATFERSKQPAELVLHQGSITGLSPGSTLTLSGNNNGKTPIGQANVSGSFKIAGTATGTVPNVLGLTGGDANFVISNSGFNPNFLGGTSSGATAANNGTVASQSPAGGTTANLDSTVSYTTYSYTPIPAPSTPSGLFVNNQTTTQLRLNWTASTGTVSDYQVTLNGSNVATTTNTFYTFTGLSANTTYTLGVRARGPDANSGLATINGTTLPLTFTTPNVVGLLRDNAVTTLRNAGFATDVGITLTTAGATEVNNLRVISQSPASGTTATVGDSASINIYNYLLSVPNIIGLTQAAANSTLTSAGFTLFSSSLTTAGATVSNNLKVGSQNPTSGTLANPANTVTFTIFNFLTQVPNVVGQQLDAALTNLSAVGFVTVTTTLDEDGATQENVGTVKSQNPINSSTTYNPANTSVSLVVYSLGVTGRRRTDSGFTPLTNAKRFDGNEWRPLIVQKRFNGTSWVDISN